MANGRHIENRFWLHLGALLGDWREIRNVDDKSHADRGHMTKNGNFPNFKVAYGRHFENSFRCLRHPCNELLLSSVFK